MRDEIRTLCYVSQTEVNVKATAGVATDVRIVIKDGEPWWVLSDVAKVLGYKLATHAARLLPDDEQTLHAVKGAGGERSVLLVNEPGLYRLIMSSRKQEAERFKRWVFHDVLPKIRREGRYVAPSGPVLGPSRTINFADHAATPEEADEITSPLDAAVAARRQLLKVGRQISELESRLDYLRQVEAGAASTERSCIAGLHAAIEQRYDFASVVADRAEQRDDAEPSIPVQIHA